MIFRDQFGSREALFEVTTVVFEVGEAIEPHDHPDMTGVILCVLGIHIENFDQLDFGGKQ